MADLVFLKLGGSLITDKRSPGTFRGEVSRRIGEEIRHAVADRDVRLLIGHGAGSFAHVPAARYQTSRGIAGGGGWKGYAETRREVVRLNSLLLDAFAEADFHPLAVAPSSCARASGGVLRSFDTALVQAFLQAGQVPLVFGDVILDDRQGFTICSTESIFEFLARSLRPTRVLVACDVDGILAKGSSGDGQQRPIPAVTTANIQQVRRRLDEAQGADVTGGMAEKLNALARLSQVPGVREARIFSGLIAGGVAKALRGEHKAGTLVRCKGAP